MTITKKKLVFGKMREASYHWKKRKNIGRPCAIPLAPSGAWPANDDLHLIICLGYVQQMMIST
jgi:hypothetical protein